MSSRWINQFLPREYVNSNYYENLLEPPTLDEWLSVLTHLPKDKAAGPSGITNEMLTNLGDKLQYLLWQLICMCFIVGDIPNEWKIAHIFPIPKPTAWECNLTNTRPITLLETARKGFVKILNN